MFSTSCDVSIISGIFGYASYVLIGLLIAGAVAFSIVLIVKFSKKKRK